MMDINVVEKTEALVDGQETSTEEKTLNKSEKEDLFIKLLTGQEATGKVETSRGTFTVKFPKAKDKIAISRLMSMHRGGLPVSSFDFEAEERNLICSTLNVLVVDSPDWLKEVKKKNKSFSFEEVPDEKFLVELYQKACEFRDEVQQSFEAKEKSTDRGLPASQSVGSNVEHGAFDGTSGSTD